MAIERADTPYVGDERAILVAMLDWQRTTLARKCDGLTEEQLQQQAVPPSTLSLLGLVRHMAEVERAWFRIRVNGESLPWRWVNDNDPDAEINDAPTARAEEAFAAWNEEMTLARGIIDAAPGLDVSFQHPERGEVSLRWVLLHMVEEYSRHNGHADFLREVIDGTTGY